MLSLPQVLIIELGSQYTLLIDRALRELGVRSVVMEHNRAGQWLRKYQPKAIILSGSSSSTYERWCREPPQELWNFHVPILGICYGMQWLANRWGASVKPLADNREYGKTVMRISRPDCLFNGTPSSQVVWMSHGDSVAEAPSGWEILARSERGTIAAMRAGDIWGVQFHPEVTHTEYGKNILKNFTTFAKCIEDWRPLSMVQSIQDDVVARVHGQRTILGFSGGVDSTTLAAMLSPVLKDELIAVTIDGGQLRAGELQEIRSHAQAAGVALHTVNAQHDFFGSLVDVIDAEEKRRCFKQVYQSIFVRYAKEVGARVIVQGTLAPDRIESGGTGGDTIKSHHNIGLDVGDLQQVHPIDHLFKYEIRLLAREMELQESIHNRQPFPGPGLFLRVVGLPITKERCDLVRWADARVKEVLVRHGAYDQISQLVVACLGVKIVGIKGDARVYSYPIGIRAVETDDFMTAKGVHFSEEIEDEISRTLEQHPAIAQVGFFPADKPPATVEFE